MFQATQKRRGFWARRRRSSPSFCAAEAVLAWVHRDAGPPVVWSDADGNPPFINYLMLWFFVYPPLVFFPVLAFFIKFLRSKIL